jgi:hypothetical protein
VSAPGDTHPELRYEQRDVSAGAIVRFALALVVVVLLASALLLGLFRLLARQERRYDPPPPPLAQEAGRLPPAPRLQSTPLQDLEELRAAEEKELTSYGWVDEKAGIAHIPIDEAIKIVAARGLPHAAPSPPAAASPAPPAPPPPSAPGARR